MTSYLTDNIKGAIRLKMELKITAKYGLGNQTIEVPFQPYIFGEDSLQYEFVWGYLSYSMLFYKFNIDNIISATLNDIVYDVLPNACYQYSMEEEHYAIIDGFDNIYSDAAKPINSEK